ncbi:MAG: hypothetical protein Q7K45_06650 [Nanoarchaeota archaeon]|nr:hypothetical protein [Nanoarchaeota archaeon]
MSLEVVTSAHQYIGAIELKAKDMSPEEKIRLYAPHTFVPMIFCSLEPEEAKTVMEYFSKRIEEVRNYSSK